MWQKPYYFEGDSPWQPWTGGLWSGKIKPRKQVVGVCAVYDRVRKMGMPKKKLGYFT